MKYIYIYRIILIYILTFDCSIYSHIEPSHRGSIFLVKRRRKINVNAVQV